MIRGRGVKGTVRSRRRSIVTAFAVLAGLSGAQALDLRSRPYAPTAADRAAVQALAEAPATAFAADAFTAPDGTVLPFRLRSPAVSPGDTLPLVVLLHGAGSMGRDNAAQLSADIKAWAEPAIADRFRAHVVAPQFAARSADYAPDADGELAARPGAPFSAVLALIEHLKERLPVDRSRVYVVGFSMGASTALLAAAREPERFAGIVSFSGVGPERRLAPAAARTPVLFVHGTADTQNPFGSARAWAEALAAAGGRPLFLALEGMGHEVPPDAALAPDWREWLFAQARR